MLKRIVMLVDIDELVDLSILAEMLSGRDALDVSSESNMLSTSSCVQRTSD